jgi:tRNA-2-methylthio-N6-dimethylallyladenosine synthase
MGRTACNRVVNFIAPPRLVGSLAEVRIDEVRGHSLRGEIVAA